MSDPASSRYGTAVFFENCFRIRPITIAMIASTPTIEKIVAVLRSATNSSAITAPSTAPRIIFCILALRKLAPSP